MEQEAIETFKHKKYDVNIYQDTDSEQNPDDWGNTELFLVAFHGDFQVERKEFDKVVCQYLAGDKDKDDWVIDRAKEVAKQYHTFGLEAYIHSGVVLALSHEGNFPDRQWDVSQLGLVFVEKKVWTTRKKAREAALGLIKEWNSCLSGEVYGFTVTKHKKCKTCNHEEDEVLESCWGFVGDLEYCKVEALAAAKAL